MLSADGGGGGGTDWQSMDVPTMWSLIENQDTTPHYETLTGWQKSYELVLEHLSQVQNYRENLAAAWPPDKSPASAAYVTQLDDLIQNLQRTYDAAVANHGALAGATLSLSLSRNDLKKIYDEYTANQSKLAAFDAKPKPVQYGRVPVLPPKPPVTVGQQETLNNQARLLMSRLSTDLVQAQMSLTAPPTFVPPALAGREGPAETNPVFVPPIIAANTSPESHSKSGSSNGTSTHLKSESLHSSESITSSTITGSRQPGLVLGGASPITVAPPNPSNLGLPLPAAGGPIQNVITQPPILPTPSVPYTHEQVPTPATTRNFAGERAGTTPVGRSPLSGPRPMPAGTVIGGAPGTGLGQPGVARGSAQRVNPIGGVIQNAGSEARGGTRSSGFSTSGQPLMSGGRRSGRRAGADESATWDPDNPWETAEGVAPVVLPSTEQPVDPGPAIGLG